MNKLTSSSATKADKILKILETLTITSRVVDDFGAAVDDLNNRFAIFEGMLNDFQTVLNQQAARLEEIGSEISEIYGTQSEIKDASAALTRDIPDMNEIAQRLRMQELDDMRREAREAMNPARVALVRLIS